MPHLQSIPISHVPPIETNNGEWARSNTEKAKTFAEYLAVAFQPNNINSDITPIYSYADSE